MLFAPVRVFLTVLMFCMLLLPTPTSAKLTGKQNILVLRVYFNDFSSNTRFTSSATKTYFDDLADLWGKKISYGAISLNFQITDLYKVPGNSTTYLNAGFPIDKTGTQRSNVGNSSGPDGFTALVNDAVAAAPKSVDWSNLYSVVVLFADTRTNTILYFKDDGVTPVYGPGFYRGLTYAGVPINTPKGQLTLPVSVVGEDPDEDPTTAWGRWGHEIGHGLQAAVPVGPAHPSNYNSTYEIMDGEYPAQSGAFQKLANRSFPGWLPAEKYKKVTPPDGAEVTIWALENPPTGQPDVQAVQAFLASGGPQVYYLVSVRRKLLGDDINSANTPPGISDEGVLIERVVENGDNTIDDCKCVSSATVDCSTVPAQPACYRWVDPQWNGDPINQKIWHESDKYSSAADGITITVEKKIDADHYLVRIDYRLTAGAVPDVGLNSWLSPPGNTYETTDIWVDSPVNGYGTYKYGTWSDEMGGIVPIGNGDDPAVGLTNRLYARVRNFGTAPATDVQVTFEISDPPGVGVNSTTWKQLGQVTQAQFTGLAQIAPGDHVDVYLEWIPDFALTPDQIKQGTFAFHTCVRVRLNHVANETFFANQDGDGQQENIMYFQATGSKAPGSPGAPMKMSMHLQNDSPTQSKLLYLSVLRTRLPNSWEVKVNDGNPVVSLGPGEKKDVPVVLTQRAGEAVGTRHSFRVLASEQVTLQSPQQRFPHNEARPIGGVAMQVAVLRKTGMTCRYKNGVVTGVLKGLQKESKDPVRVLVAGIGRDLKLSARGPAGGAVKPDGTFSIKFSPADTGADLAICLFAGTNHEASAVSNVFSAKP
jgi:hypothetical protein